MKIAKKCKRNNNEEENNVNELKKNNKMKQKQIGTNTILRRIQSHCEGDIMRVACACAHIHPIETGCS